MKKVLIIVCLLVAFKLAKSQNMNWALMNDSLNQSVEATLSLDYGITYGVGYNYVFNTMFPLALHGDVSIPSGENLLDDYKIKTGAVLRLTQIGDVYVDAGLMGITRSYNSDFVRIFNFGSEANLNIGYYRKHWYIGANISYDKAIVSNFKHTDDYKNNFPEVVDGWYEPESGGNIKFGGKVGGNFGKNGIVLQAGLVKTEELNSSPLIPFYAGLGYTYNW